MTKCEFEGWTGRGRWRKCRNKAAVRMSNNARYCNPHAEETAEMLTLKHAEILWLLDFLKG